jgi:hypothetical protein
MVETGTNTELAKTSGKTTTNPAVCAASAPRTASAKKAKIQLRAKPKAAQPVCRTRRDRGMAASGRPYYALLALLGGEVPALGETRWQQLKRAAGI